MEIGTFSDWNIFKGEMGKSFAERESFQQERDKGIVGLVNRYGTVSADDLAAIIGYTDTPQGVENAYRLLKRIKEAGEIQLFDQYGVHYALKVDISLRKQGAKAQFVHRALEAKRRMVMDQVVTFEQYRTGTELRAAAKERDAILDGFGQIGTRGWGFEDETGSHTIPEMINKATRLYAQLSRLKILFNVTRLQVIWSLNIEKQVLPLVAGLKSIGNGGGLFLVTHHPATYDLQHLKRFAAASFLSPLDGKLHGFMEE